jgi:hypothetical protein
MDKGHEHGKMGFRRAFWTEGYTYKHFMILWRKLKNFDKIGTKRYTCKSIKM